jgi:hypothetical protein
MSNENKEKMSPILVSREQKDQLEVAWHTHIAGTNNNISFKEFVVMAISAYKG